MADQRCTCDEPGCTICHSLGSALPWTPAPGDDSVQADIARMMEEDAEARAEAVERWERWQTVRRYLLVLLLALVGGMIGGMSSALTLLYYFN